MWFGAILAAALVALAVVGPLLTPWTYTAQNLAPGAQYAPPSAAHWLGADDLGRDVFTRLAMGARISLGVALGVEAIALTLGLFFGLLAGYYGGLTDTLIMRLTDITFAFPDLLLAILIAAVLTAHTATPAANLLGLFVALGVTSWPGMARLVRGQAMLIKRQEFVDAARALGAGDLHIMGRHLLPNLIGPVVIALVTDMAGVILAEATLSFLGIGMQPPFPSWGTMIASARSGLRSHPEQALYPAVALACAVLAFNFLGDGLRDRLDPRMRGA